MFEAFVEEEPVRQPGERVVQRLVVEPVRGSLGVVARLGVEEVRGSHIGKGLRRRHVALVEGARAVSIEVERAETATAVTEREREDGRQAGRDGGGREQREPGVTGKSATATAPPVSNAARHGPWPTCVCNCSYRSAASSDAAM